MSTLLAGRAVLVTGATGTVGQQLVALLADSGAQVRIMTRDVVRARALWPTRNIDIRQADLLLPGLDALCVGMDVVFHLASFQPGAGVVDSESGKAHWQVSVDGTEALLQAITDASSLVFVSSVRAGDGSDSDYALAKREAEQRVLAARTADRQVSILRLPPVYGGSEVGMVPTFIRSIDSGRFKTLPDFGERRSLVHRSDVARAAVMLATDARASGRTYTVTDGEIYSLRSIYEMSCQAMAVVPKSKRSPDWLLNTFAVIGDVLQMVTRRQMPVSRKRLAKMRVDAWYDGSAIQAELGFTPDFTLEKVLPELVARVRGLPDD